jgi:hypothetical protein
MMLFSRYALRQLPPQKAAMAAGLGQSGGLEMEDDRCTPIKRSDAAHRQVLVDPDLRC